MSANWILCCHVQTLIELLNMYMYLLGTQTLGARVGSLNSSGYFMLLNSKGNTSMSCEQSRFSQKPHFTTEQLH